MRLAAIESRTCGVFGARPLAVTPAGAIGAPKCPRTTPLSGKVIEGRTGRIGITEPLRGPGELSRGAVVLVGAAIGATTGGAIGIVDGMTRGAAGTAIGAGADTRGVGRTSGLGFRGSSTGGGSSLTAVGGSESIVRDAIQRGMGVMDASAARNALVVMAMETPRLDQCGPAPR